MRRGLYAIALVTCLVLLAGLAVGCGGSGADDGATDSSGGPTINSISPASGPPMTPLLIYGSGFGKSGSGGKVEFNGNAIGIKTWSETEIDATVPTGTAPGTYKVTVVAGDQTSQAMDFEVTAAQ